MRRLLRWTFHTLAAASLLLCLVTAGLWGRSYWVYDHFEAVLELRPLATEDAAEGRSAFTQKRPPRFHGR